MSNKSKSPKELKDLAVGVLAGLMAAAIWDLIKYLAS